MTEFSTVRTHVHTVCMYVQYCTYSTVRTYCMYVRTVLYVQYLMFLKTRKISEDLPICYRIRAVHGSRPFRAGPKPYRRASGTWQNPYSQRFCSKVLAKILQSAWLCRLPGASLAGRPLSARVFRLQRRLAGIRKDLEFRPKFSKFGFLASVCMYVQYCMYST